MTEAITWIVDALKWLVGLADPENLKSLVNLGGPWWVSYGVLSAVVFSETGLLIGFFLPGDSLLFAAGFLASQGVFNLLWLNVCLILAAVAGDAVNYYLGRRMNDLVFEKGRLRFVKHEYLLLARDFYDRHGGKAIVLARFAPLVRTFTPFVAGVARMGYRRFAVYNVLGAAAWVVSMTLAGYWLGRIPLVARNFEAAVLIVVVISLLPLVAGGLKHRRRPRDKEAACRSMPAE